MSDSKVTPMPRRARPGPESTAEGSTTQGKEGATNKRVLKAIVIGPTVKENLTTGKTKELPTDSEVNALTSSGRLIEPPFDPLVLAMLLEHSTELQPCVEAMEINIDGTGYRLDPRVRVDVEGVDAGLKGAVEAERIELTNFFSNCCVDESFVMLRRKTRRDIETTGNGYWEAIRRPNSGKLQGFNHIPSHQMRLGRLDDDFTEFDRKVPTLLPGGEVKLVTERTAKRFRRFAQLVSGRLSTSSKIRWFKEYQDPRVIDNRTGDVATDDLPEEHRASEIIHWKLYSPRSPYGLPRFIGNLITLFGDRAADEINFVTLKNNNIPSMAITVANGQLTDGSIQRITEFVETQIQGSSNYSRFLVIEAEGAFEGGDSPSNARVEIKPLSDQQMRDQMFQEYGKNNANKIRRAFRLPPIFTGHTEDYNRATAETSRELADDQVFKPERDEFDNAINKLVLAEMGARFHKFISNGTNTTDPETLIKVLMAAERTGGLTPRISRQIMSDVMGRDLPEINPEHLDPDVPFSIQIAERVKNMAAQETGSPEVGSQVTALKMVEVAKARTPRELMAALLLQRDAAEDDLLRTLTGEEA